MTGKTATVIPEHRALRPEPTPFGPARAMYPININDGRQGKYLAYAARANMDAISAVPGFVLLATGLFVFLLAFLHVCDRRLVERYLLRESAFSEVHVQQ